MIADLKPYPAYKESGIPWIGIVPSDWRVERTKCIFRSRKELNVGRQNTNVLSLTLRGVVNNDPESPEGMVPKDYATYQLFKKHDLVFKLIDLENIRTSRVGLVHEDGIMSSAYVRLAPTKSVNIRFFYLQFFDLYTRAVFNTLGAGVRSTLGAADLGELRIVIPPPAEQTAIVRFLDLWNGRLEKAIRSKRRVIALLQEQKQAIIHRAVTRGLDPTVKLKDSAIPWLGEIPEHWEVRRNMALFSLRVESGVEGLPVLQVSLRSGITMEELDQFGRPKKLIADATKYKRVHQGDMAYNTMRMWQGAVGVSPCDGLVSPAYVVITPRGGTVPEFYDYVFHTDLYKQQVNRQSTGIVSDRNRLYWDSFKQMPNLVLPETEQRDIISFILKETGGIGTAIARFEREITLLREYRTRLTADVVTGKLDVRAAAAQLPEEAEEEPLPDPEIPEEEPELEEVEG
jgi:type I restriction enzyme S subunit